MMDITYAFSAWLECSDCAEQISCCGIGGYEPFETNDEDGNPIQEYGREFWPRYFSHPMAFFRPPTQCPKAIKDEVFRSFAVFYCDRAAAANHIRQCVENILLHLGIQPQDAEGNFISLASRIEEFRRRSPENAERADALRHIGNYGSHPGVLTRDDLFDAYDILDGLLEDLFVGHQRSIREIIAQIIANRGPRGRT